MTTCISAVLITIAVFVGLTVLLLAAERWLVNYGTCVLTVNGGEQVIEQVGGGNLMTALQDNGIHVPASCGGKGACGYCKVVVPSGGGPVLPTELPFLSRAELLGNVRLSCQVKVKNNMEVSVPDFLSVVKTIVTNQTYDASRRWRFVVE